MKGTKSIKGVKSGKREKTASAGRRRLNNPVIKMTGLNESGFRIKCGMTSRDCHGLRPRNDIFSRFLDYARNDIASPIRRRLNNPRRKQRG
ncbi:MAG: hypothetical protein PHY02_06605 [Phycisphaerae bacterium]|nr:hypothetical protein [Phycisphaerae bacterium]